MDDLNNSDIRQGILQQSPIYTLYLPLFSSGIISFYVGVYILRYCFWRIKQRRRKVRLLEYEKLRWAWHQKQTQLHYQTKKDISNIDMNDEQDAVNIQKYKFPRSPSSSSSSLSVTTISENETKIKAKQNQQQQYQNKCDYGDDSSHCRETSLIVTIPSPAYQPSHNHHLHSTTKPRLQNKKPITQLHHHHHKQQQQQHQHPSSSSSSSTSTTTSSSYIKKENSSGHQRSSYSSSSSTTTLTCSCVEQQHRCKKENTHIPGTSPFLPSSPTALSLSNPTSPSSSLKETKNLFYPKQEKDNHSHQDNGRSQAHAFIPIYDKKCASNTSKTKNPSSSYSSYWSFYDTKAKRTRMIWKWSVAMGYCHYAHAKLITSIIDQLEPSSSQELC